VLKSTAIIIEIREFRERAAWDSHTSQKTPSFILSTRKVGFWCDAAMAIG
jgi:hypothetical protein